MLFYNSSTGKPLTLGQIYDRFESAISDKMAVFNKHRAHLTQFAAASAENKGDVQNAVNHAVASDATSAHRPAALMNGAVMTNQENSNYAVVRNFGAFAAAEQARLLSGLTHKNQNPANNARDPVNLLQMIIEADHAAKHDVRHPSMQPVQGMTLGAGIGTATAFGQNPALMGLSHIALAQATTDLSPDAASLRRQGAQGGAQAAYLRPRQISQTFKI